MQVIEAGTAPYLTVDPDVHRAYVREHKERRPVRKLMDEHEAISRFVADGDYLAYDCNYLNRGPASLIREIIRQRKRDLWLCGKFTYVAVSLFVAGGCASKVDVGFFGRSPVVEEAVREGRLELFEYSNVTLTLRLRAGAAGQPFATMRAFGGTDGFKHSGAKLVVDPFTERPITLLPALNPDVAIIHVNQADEHGNARVFGTGIAHTECALASKKVILSADEIISPEEMRRSPGLNAIPHYAVDAVVEAPFGAYPGNSAGYYASHREHTMEIYDALRRNAADEYLDKWVRSVDSHDEMLEKLVGANTLIEIQREETIQEGYRA